MTRVSTYSDVRRAHACHQHALRCMIFPLFMLRPDASVWLILICPAPAPLAFPAAAALLSEFSDQDVKFSMAIVHN